VSGIKEEVDGYVRQLKNRGIKTWKVKTDIAFHSPLLKELVPLLQDSLQGALHPRSGSLPIYSTSDPNPRTKALRDMNYWTHNSNCTVGTRASHHRNIDVDVKHRVGFIHFLAQRLCCSRGLRCGTIAADDRSRPFHWTVTMADKCGEAPSLSGLRLRQRCNKLLRVR
jgi:hypothetical protein